MIFTETELKGAFVVELQTLEDERGFFARTWCEHEFAERGLNTKVSQCSLSFNIQQGTLRGMHYQIGPSREAKLVRCVRGSIYDVIIDLRPGSATFKRWIAVELNEENHRALYIPEQFAHGYQTLRDNTEVFYQISNFYAPAQARGLRWNDPAFKIRWPNDQRVISARDRGYADFSSATEL
jgi:dTDP-4-dehydrorhamnose 3,5-epimerase